MSKSFSMTAVGAVSSNWAIGEDNDLIFKNKHDLMFFKKLTYGGAVIMGRKTFESLPNGALPGRLNIVLTSSKDFKSDKVKVVNSVKELFKYLNSLEIPVFLIGGGMMYRTLLGSCDKVVLNQFEEEHKTSIKTVYFPTVMLNQLFEKNAETTYFDGRGFKTMIYVRRQ